MSHLRIRFPGEILPASKHRPTMGRGQASRCLVGEGWQLGGGVVESGHRTSDGACVSIPRHHRTSDIRRDNLSSPLLRTTLLKFSGSHSIPMSLSTGALIGLSIYSCVVV